MGQKYAVLCFLAVAFGGSMGISCNSLSEKKTLLPLSVQKVWIRETFPKDLTRPSIQQSIKPVLRTDGLVIQGNESHGIVAYTTTAGKKSGFSL